MLLLDKDPSLAAQENGKAHRKSSFSRLVPLWAQVAVMAMMMAQSGPLQWGQSGAGEPLKALQSCFQTTQSIKTHALEEVTPTPEKSRLGIFLVGQGRLRETPFSSLESATSYGERVQEIASGQGEFCNGDPVNYFDPDGRESLLLIQRSQPTDAQIHQEGTVNVYRDAPGAAYLYHNGQLVDASPVNANGYMKYPNGNQAHGIYAGTDYTLQPRTGAGQNDYPNGTPAVTGPGQSNPGDTGIGDYHYVFVHPQSSQGRPDSLGCLTVTPEFAAQVTQAMNQDQTAGDITSLHIYNYAGAPYASPVLQNAYIQPSQTGDTIISTLWNDAMNLLGGQNNQSGGAVSPVSKSCHN